MHAVSLLKAGAAWRAKFARGAGYGVGEIYGSARKKPSRAHSRARGQGGLLGAHRHVSDSARGTVRGSHNHAVTRCHPVT
jgi:hypothetical protein